MKKLIQETFPLFVLTFAQTGCIVDGTEQDGALDALGAEAATASYYVAPNGSGSACKQVNPCSLNTGLSKAGPGAEVVLMDGTYGQRLTTQRGGAAGKPIVIRAQNRHKAILRRAKGDNAYKGNLDIDHSHIVVRDLVFDGDRRGGAGVQIVGTTGKLVSDVVVEWNRVLNSGGTGMHMQYCKELVIRHNYVDGAGYWAPFGEGLYISGTNGSPVEDVEIYGNTIRDTTNNFIDYKRAARRIFAHHNIFEKHVMKAAHAPHEYRPDDGGDDGLIRSAGDNDKPGNRFEDNIVRNSESNSIIRFSGNRVDAIGNVFHDIDAKNHLHAITSSGAPFQIRDNTFCNTPNKTSEVSAKDVQLVNNSLDAPMSACNAEVDRILKEMTKDAGTDGW